MSLPLYGPDSTYRLVRYSHAAGNPLQEELAPQTTHYAVVVTEDGSSPQTTLDPEQAIVLKRDAALAWLALAHARGATVWGLAPTDPAEVING